MASGQTLLTKLAGEQDPGPSSNWAPLSARNFHPVLLFDATTQESAIFTAIMPRNYGGGGITAYIHWSAASATSGACVWDVAFERVGEGSQDTDADGFASAQQASAATAPGTSGNVDIQTVAFTDGAQMDSVGVGELFRLRVRRVPADSGDTMTGDAELHAIELKET